MTDDFEEELKKYKLIEYQKLDVKPNGMFGNWAFHIQKKREFETIWREARKRASRDNDDSFE